MQLHPFLIQLKNFGKGCYSMKKVDFPKNIQCLIQQSIDTLKLKLSVINKGHTQDYFFEYIFETAIKHSINDMCCELLNFTEVVDSEKTGQIVSYQKKWGNYEYNLNIHDKTKLKKEEKATNKIINYIQRLTLAYKSHENELIKKAKEKDQYPKTIKRLEKLYVAFTTLDKIIDKAIESN